MENPFSLSFGKEPQLYISRPAQLNAIKEDFLSENPPNQVYMITGVRGSGKTVALSSLAADFKRRKNWIVLEINPVGDILRSIAAKLYDIPELRKLFIKAKFDFSLFGLGVSLEKETPVTDIDTVLTQMLGEIAKVGKRVLICIDEVVKDYNIRVFSGTFQILMRNNYPVFLIMTGLYDNIYNLQNDRSLTFLYRAPKIELAPLSMTAIVYYYKDVFQITDGLASVMGQLTKGYPYAFQVLGYLYWENRSSSLEQLLPKYDQYLEEYVYEKIWSELSRIERSVVLAIARGKTRVKDIRNESGLSSEEFAVYRRRLSRKGIIDTSTYGIVRLSLPRFGEISRILSGDFDELS